jgi:hypothetical protein
LHAGLGDNRLGRIEVHRWAFKKKLKGKKAAEDYNTIWARPSSLMVLRGSDFTSAAAKL